MNALPYWIALACASAIVLMIPSGDGLLLGIVVFIVLALIFRRLYEEWDHDL